MGRKRSVYLSDATDAALEAAGVPLPEVIRRGLEAIQMDAGATVAPAAAARAAGKPKRTTRATGCPHGYPDVRQVAGRAVCRKCGPV